MSAIEEWRPVISYGRRFVDLYEASSLGRIRSKHTGKYSGEPLAQALAGRDRHYFYVRLWDGRGRTCPVAMLVAEAFLGPKPVGMEINHKNGDRTDNRVANFEYIPRTANHRHAANLGLHAWGGWHGMAKLTPDQAREVRDAPRTRGSIDILAAKFGVSRGCIQSIRSGKSWRHLDEPGLLVSAHGKREFTQSEKHE